MSTSKVEQVFDLLGQKGVRFVEDAVNEGWFFYHLIAVKSKTGNGKLEPQPDDGMLYLDRTAAIYAAAEYYGIKDLVQLDHP